MIDERQEELASLYAFDLLEGTEKLAFEQELPGNAELAALVDELRTTAASILLAGPLPAPSPELKERIFARISANKAAAEAPSNVIVFSKWIPWSIAAGFALAAAGLAQSYLAVKRENLALHEQESLAQIELKSARNLLEAQTLITGRHIADLTDETTKLREQQSLAQNEVKALHERLQSDAIRTEKLVAQLQQESDLARLKIATLTSLAGKSPQAQAVAVWDPTQQKGVLTVANLAAPRADQDYQLWVVDPQSKDPISAGLIPVNANGEGKTSFTPERRITAALKFAVSLERKGGVAKTEGPIVLLGGP
ncbi:MAG TPA: anti-sigma factor [Opitutaceae bacterium]|nr:anti-sigma factor [Opitutaceae bacterium]